MIQIKSRNYYLPYSNCSELLLVGGPRVRRVETRFIGVGYRLCSISQINELGIRGTTWVIKLPLTNSQQIKCQCETLT